MAIAKKSMIESIEEPYVQSIYHAFASMKTTSWSLKFLACLVTLIAASVASAPLFWNIIKSAKVFLTMAMAAVGISINLSELKSMGYKPFVVGLIAAVTVGIISLIYIETLKNFLI